MLICVVFQFLDVDNNMPKEAGLLVSFLMAQNRSSQVVYIGDDHLSGKVAVFSS